MTYELGPQPVILVRGKDGAVRAHANTCRHRMMRLVEGHGNTSRFTCPYHAWTYGMTGGLPPRRIWSGQTALTATSWASPVSAAKSTGLDLSDTG